ncbi:tripartite motif-containing protein 49C isoform X2 [Pongo abelii]|uniref:tripartite motif-containing protein 49C isoform X2 n=1 Tax=Pongo abelii TaxID=9601 RepID=UPI0023E2555C|nr:tripartite motif-containing protein 49C isoform X2 [Pongo pygmaeus]XP_054294936.1 tripartite motif-containing protein 49C isoform X2 [Pongo pygmaeus]XP_054380870.1 tripartite motif-containing protein 49C isoform X2 [Pongo abelii]XP_054382178.1 tripartite motif-containing protein 49C isoform X2 [Pongo abelii]
MNSGILQVFQRELTCPICMNYFIDPVTIDCGHSFCRPCFYLNWQDIPVLVQCSECTKSIEQINLKTNIHLKKMASLARKVSLWLFLSSEEQMCGTHRETKKMFCEVDKSLLCLLCSSSQEHRNHRHCPIESAAEEHREKLLQKMQSLWEKACENHRNLNVETTRTRHWKAFGDILHRSESVLLHMPQPLNPELSAGPITGLMDRLNEFRVHITLQHEEANSHIFLYEILRSMCIGCDHQDVPYITATPRSFLAWGAQTFTSGKYYWEVHVGESWNWAFGVCNMYWKEKNQNEKIDGEEGLFLLGCVKNDIQRCLFTTSPLMLQYIPKPTSRVGLFLDYEAKTVSFVDVNQSSLIYTIPNCSFSPPLRPIFCRIHF